MSPEYQMALKRLKAAGWRVSVNESPCDHPQSIRTRFAWLPEEIRQFVNELKVAVSADEKIWLLGAPDFCGLGLSAYRWNEWEQMSLDAARGNSKLTDSIRSFWDTHFPIATSVKSGYAYFAVRKTDFGVVCGEEPEFEVSSVIASSFLEFLNSLGKCDPKLKRWV